MGPVGLGIAAVSIAAASAGYGVYAGERAQQAQANAVRNAQSQADQQRKDQQSQYAQQQAQMAAQTQANLAQEAQTKADTQAAQQQALTAEQAAIGTNSTTLSNSLANQNTAAMTKQEPLLENRLNALGLLSSGALPEGQAKYQADLQAQADATLANYQIGAQGQLTQNTNAATADQVRQSEANALLNIQNGEQNMATNFSTVGANNANNTAYDSYINSLRMGQAQGQQSAANSYVGLGGTIAGGALQYYGNQNNNAALQALQAQQQMYGNVNQFSNTYNPNQDYSKINASNGNTVGTYLS